MNNIRGRVLSLIIGSDAREPLESVPYVTAEAGRGLLGDRYYYGRGSFNAPQFEQSVREVTLIAAESIDACNRRLGTSLEPEAFRRNIVTEGVDLSALKGRFRIGEVVLRRVRSAPPCRYLSRLLGEDMMTGLKGLGGIRAVIETGGRIRVGDEVDVLP